MSTSTRQTQIITNGNAQLHVVSYPKPGAETILLLHGGPGTPDEMPEVASLLTPNYQVIYFDQRGSGNSVCVKECTYSVDDHLSDMRVIFDHFKLEKVHLFGHSWGGLLAQLFANNFPELVRSLFLCSPASGTGWVFKQLEFEMTMYGLSRSSPFEWPAIMYKMMLGKMGIDSGTQQYYKHFHDIAHRGFPVEAPENADVQTIKSEPTNQTRNSIVAYPHLPSIMKVPFQVTTTFSAADTDIFKMARMHVITRFPDAKVITIPEAGHFPWLHNLPEFTSALGSHFTLR